MTRIENYLPNLNLSLTGKALNSLSDKILAEIKGKMHGAEEQPRPKINDDAPQLVDKPVAFKSALEYEQGNHYIRLKVES